MVVDLLHQLALGTHRLERLHKRGAQQPFRRDRLAAGSLVQRLEAGIKRAKRAFDDYLDHPQWMVGTPLFKVDIREQRS